MDTEDLGTLGQMMALGSEYIAEQDEGADQANVPKMQEALGIIGGLVPYELQESEPAEPAEDE
jgi:hypothetical protein